MLLREEYVRPKYQKLYETLQKLEITMLVKRIGLFSTLIKMVFFCTRLLNGTFLRRIISIMILNTIIIILIIIIIYIFIYYYIIIILVSDIP